MESEKPSRSLRFLRLGWAAWLVLVVTVSLLPGESRPIQALSALPFGAKIHHAASYALLGFLPVLRERRRTAIALLVAVTVLGGVVEVLQPYTGRTTDLMDWMANLAGMAVGAWIALLFRPSSPTRVRPSRVASVL